MLIASVVLYTRSTGRASVALLTQDAGVRLTSRMHGVPVYELSPEFAIPEELDPLEKENRELKQSLAKATNTRPDLKAVFMGSDTYGSFAKHSLSPPIAIDEEELAANMERIKAKYPYHEVQEDDYLKRQMRAGLAFSDFIRPEKWIEYNEKLDQFYLEQEAYFRELHETSNRKRLVLPIKIGVMNSGRGPADDVDISLHFPDGFELVSKGGLPKDPPVPSPPAKPLSPMEEAAATNAYLLRSLRPYTPSVPTYKPPSAFNIRKTNSYEVTDHTTRIKQGKTYELKRLFAIFENYDLANSFNLAYKVQPANNPEPFTGELHIVVEKG